MASDVIDLVHGDERLERATSIYRRAAIEAFEAGQPERVVGGFVPRPGLDVARRGLRVIDGGKR